MRISPIILSKLSTTPREAGFEDGANVDVSAIALPALLSTAFSTAVAIPVASVSLAKNYGKMK